MRLEVGTPDEVSCGCFYELGVHFVGVLITRGLPFGVYIRALIFGNSHVEPDYASISSGPWT